MSVRKDERNKNESQDRLLQSMEELSRSIASMSGNDHTRITNENITAQSIRFMSTAIHTIERNIERLTEHITGSALFMADSDFGKFITGIDEYTKAIEEATKATEEKAEEEKKSGSTFSSILGGLGRGLSALFGQLGGLSGIGKEVDKLSEYSNQMIRISGMNGSLVRGFRSDIFSIVSDLNKTTGYLYSPIASYEKIVSIAQNVTGSLDAMKEMARPLLLAQESLNVDISNVADIFNRFYVRYSFSSTHMEDTLDAIRGNTAGNSANAEATLKNIKSLENWIGYTAGNDSAKLQEMMESISHYTSWLESMGVESSPYTQYLKDIAYGDYSKNTELVNILGRSGISATQATNMAREGQFEELTKALMEGISEIFESTETSYALGRALDNYSLNRDMAFEARNVMKSSGYVSLEDFVESTNASTSTETSTMEQLAEDKYVSAMDKANHILEQMYGKLADVQESLGVGLTDLSKIITIVTSILSAVGVKSLFSGSGGGTGGTGLLSKIGSGGKALLGKIGGGSVGAGIATLGGVTAGAGMTYYGVSNAIQDFKSGDTAGGLLNSAGALGGAAGAGTLLALGASNPIGWVALAVGGIFLGAAKVHDIMTKVGTADAVAAAYDAAALDIRTSAKKQELALLEIQSNLDKDIDLEAQRQALIESGILSDTDVEKARTANKEGLQKLTEAYLKATDKWSENASLDLLEDKKYAVEYAKKLQSNIEGVFQDLNDGGKLTGGSANLEAVENFMLTIWEDLQSRRSSGEKFDDDTWEMYKVMEEVLSDYKLSKSDANDIIDAGFWNSDFLNANFGTEAMLRAVENMSKTNSAGASIADKAMKGLGDKPLDAMESQKLRTYTSQILAGATDEKGAQEMLDELKSMGLTSAKYPDIKAAADKFGLVGYDKGTNYLEEDSIILAHEGEAIVPKKYNPAANSEEIKYLANQLHQERMLETKNSREQSDEVVSVLSEIRSFLSEWKEDNKKDKRLQDAKAKYADNKAFINGYMPIQV